jgi:hypothetical protein
MHIFTRYSLIGTKIWRSPEFAIYDFRFRDNYRRKFRSELQHITFQII